MAHPASTEPARGTKAAPAFLALIRIGAAVIASVGGVLVTAVLWKAGVILGAILVPVIALFVDEALGKPLSRLFGMSGADAGAPNAWAALTIGLVGFLIVAGALTVPQLAEGEPLQKTPLFDGNVPLVANEDEASTPTRTETKSLTRTATAYPIRRTIAKPSPTPIRQTSTARARRRLRPGRRQRRHSGLRDNCPTAANPTSSTPTGTAKATSARRTARATTAPRPRIRRWTTPIATTWSMPAPDDDNDGTLDADADGTPDEEGALAAEPGDA